jgi:hypothetical protein
MTQHYTKQTVSASAMCKRCGKHTQHLVQGGLVGACTICLARPQPPTPPASAAAERGLFDKPEENPR